MNFFGWLSRITSKAPAQSPFDTIEYVCGNTAIRLPKSHLLPTYQAAHPHYDRFLPYLVRGLHPSEVVVDIGANVGDTLAAMADANTELQYVCVEGDEEFCGLLRENADRLTAKWPSLSVQVVNAIVGKDMTYSGLVGTGGTKHTVVRQGAPLQSMVSLDSILAPLAKKRIRLIKSDVDGFDFDVLASAMKTIDAHGSMLFFECQYENELQFQGYLTLIRDLKRRGYANWNVFDNFGQFILTTDEPDLLVQLLRYVKAQNDRPSTRTMYYLDILVTRSVDNQFAASVLEEYCRYQSA